MTTGVGALSPAEVDEALDRGAATAEGYRRRGLIVAAALFLAGADVGASCGRNRLGTLDTLAPTRLISP